MTTFESNFKEMFLTEIRRRILEENFPRLRKCLVQLTETETWRRPNQNSNSMGNIVLHLCGNLRQWVVAGFEKEEDIRKRQQEFDERGPLPVQYLLEEVEQIEKAITEVLDELSTEDLISTYSVQGFQETGIGILVHVTEHFSYHVGQMTYYVKAVKDMDIGYYEGINLE